MNVSGPLDKIERSEASRGAAAHLRIRASRCADRRSGRRGGRLRRSSFGSLQCRFSFLLRHRSHLQLPILRNHSSRPATGRLRNVQSPGAGLLHAAHRAIHFKFGSTRRRGPHPNTALRGDFGAFGWGARCFGGRARIAGTTSTAARVGAHAGGRAGRRDGRSGAPTGVSGGGGFAGWRRRRPSAAGRLARARPVHVVHARAAQGKQWGLQQVKMRSCVFPYRRHGGRMFM